MIGSGVFASARAQTDIPAAQQNLPPVAAPTSKIEVGAIPIVRSESEEAADFADGLITGLVGAYHVDGLAIAIVDQQRAMLLRGYGTMTEETKVPLGTLSGVFGALTAMKAVQDGKLRLEDDIAKPLGETGPRGVTLAQLLDGERNDPALVQALIAKVAGQFFADAVNAAIVKPLAMSATAFGPTGFTSTAADISHLTIALLNGGAYMDAPVLEPATVQSLEAIHRTLHEGLPGWAYGWVELDRNGARALARDGIGDSAQSRIVIVPDAKRGYFIAVTGHAPAEFWRRLDDALFDKLVPARPAAAAARPSTQPSPADARRAAGLYQGDGTSLAFGRDRIRIRAREDGALLVAGARNLVMMPAPGNLWTSGNGAMKAALVDGRLTINADQFHPVAFWKRPQLYAWLAFLAAIAALAARVFEARNKRTSPYPSEVLLATAAVTIAFALLSALVYLLAPLPA